MMIPRSASQRSKASAGSTTSGASGESVRSKASKNMASSSASGNAKAGEASQRRRGSKGSGSQPRSRALRGSMEGRRDSGIESEWVVQMEDGGAIAQLRSALNLYQGESRSGPQSCGLVEFLVDRFNGLRVEVFSREHPPPHFRVCVGGETANYRISDGAQLNGGLRRYYSVVRQWHAEHRSKLIEVWNSRRPADCPVGAYQAG